MARYVTQMQENGPSLPGGEQTHAARLRPAQTAQALSGTKGGAAAGATRRAPPPAGQGEGHVRHGRGRLVPAD